MVNGSTEATGFGAVNIVKKLIEASHLRRFQGLIGKKTRLWKRNGLLLISPDLKPLHQVNDMMHWYLKHKNRGCQIISS